MNNDGIVSGEPGREIYSFCNRKIREFVAQHRSQEPQSFPKKQCYSFSPVVLLHSLAVVILTTALGSMDFVDKSVT